MHSLLTALLALASTSPQTPVEANASHSPTPPRVVTTPTMPQAITSFGACRSNGFVYVYGGHIGREHAHSRANVVGTFLRLNQLDGHDWQMLPSGPELQGTALCTGPDGRIWRVGGMTAHNDPDADGDLHSTASVASYDPARAVWQEATPLPEARSSHDAIVLGDLLFVVGGWRLHGGEDGDWHQTAWQADLRQQPLVWTALPAPRAPRRAAALATFADKLVLLGGLGTEGMLRSVEVFEPAAAAWSEGPALPGSAFGTAALAIDTALYATVMDGRLLRWTGTGDWSTVTQLETPRFFHRMVPAAEPGRIMLLGGAGRGGHMRSVELANTQPQSEPIVNEYVIPAPGRVAYRQALLVQDNTLWCFGGNHGGGGDRFAKEQFADDIWRIDLLAREATRIGALPHGVQSMASARLGSKHGLLVGGLGAVPAGDGVHVQSLTTTWRWDGHARQLLPFANLPMPRTQCQVVSHRDRIWVLGGTDFVPDADGGSTRGDMQLVLVCDPAAATPEFQVADLRLPRPRRSFGTAVLGDSLYLVGGLADSFDAAGPVDVHDFATGTWRELALPAPWVSPQVAVIGDRLYVACGGTMAGQRFTEDRALWSFNEREGWRRIVTELPFAVRHVQMLALRNRLLFCKTNDPRQDRIVIRTLEPDAAVFVVEAAMHR
jgi:hypothetical protein